MRPAGMDELGLKRGLADQIVPLLVAAMAFLAALAIAGWIGAAALAEHWAKGAGALVTIQIPRPADSVATSSATRLEAVRVLLGSAHGVGEVKPLSDADVGALLRPWFGVDAGDLALPIPAIIAVHMVGEPVDLTRLAAELTEKIPGVIVDDHAILASNLATLARRIQLCSGLVLVIVILVTATVIAVVTSSRLAARREAVLIVLQLGATNDYIVQRFAARMAALASVGGFIGGLLALPTLFMLAALATPVGGLETQTALVAGAPASIPILLGLLPVFFAVVATLIGYVTTQISMRQWLRRLN